MIFSRVFGTVEPLVSTHETSPRKKNAQPKNPTLSSQGIPAAGGLGTNAGVRLHDMGSFFAFLDTELPGLVERWHQLRDRAARGQR